MTSPFRIFEVILYTFVNFLPYFFLALYPFTEKFRFSKKVNRILFLFLIGFEILFCLWASLFSSNNAPVSLLNTILFALFFFIAIREHPGKLFFILLMMSNLANQIVFCAKCLEGFLFPALAQQNNRWSFSLCTVIVQAVTLPLFFLFIRKQFKEAITMQTQHQIWWYLWLVPGTFYLFWFYIAYFNPLSGIELALLPIATVFAVLINTGALFVYYLIAKSNREFAENMELRSQNDRLTIENLQYENLKERMNETRRARHDLRQHMTVLHALSENKEYDKLNQYLQDYLKAVPLDHSLSYCEHFALNALLVYYAQIAENKKIIFDVHVCLPQDIPVSDTDLTVLFGNLLENACSGCLTLPEERRKICVRGAFPTPGAFVLTIDNTFDGSIKTEKEHFLSSKHPGNGIGIESVRHIADRYNGTARFTAENGMFCASVVLNL